MGSRQDGGAPIDLFLHARWRTAGPAERFRARAGASIAIVVAFLAMALFGWDLVSVGDSPAFYLSFALVAVPCAGSLGLLRSGASMDVVGSVVILGPTLGALVAIHQTGGPLSAAFLHLIPLAFAALFLAGLRAAAGVAGAGLAMLLLMAAGWLSPPSVSDEALRAYHLHDTIAAFLLTGLLAIVKAHYQELSRLELDEASQAASDAARAKAAFLATMSHEIRTPLNGVIGLSEVVAHESDADRREAILADIRRSGLHLLDLLDNILDFSQLEAGKVRLRPRAVNPRAVLERLEAMLTGAAEAKGLRFQVTMAAAMPKAVEADDGKLAQVLVNLAGNAIKFTDHGSVQVEATWLGRVGRLHRLRFRVTDTGPGLAEEHRQLVLQPFEQGVSRHEGAGLGLAIATRILEAFGSKLELSSTLGVGTEASFTVDVPASGVEEPTGQLLGATTLMRRALVSAGFTPSGPGPATSVAVPRAAGDAVDGAPDVAAEAEPTPRTLDVLVAEDNRVNRLLVRRLLEGLGHRVQEAADGAAAVKAVLERPPDVVLMDCRMPEMDGLEATRQLRARGYTELPIVAVTANALEGDRDTCIAAGMNDYLAKPISGERLARVLAGVVVAAPPAPGAAPSGLGDHAEGYSPGLDGEASVGR